MRCDNYFVSMFFSSVVDLPFLADPSSGSGSSEYKHGFLKSGSESFNIFSNLYIGQNNEKGMGIGGKAKREYQTFPQE